MTNAQNIKNGDLITLKESSQILGKAPKTIRKYTREGILDKVMVEGRFGEEMRLYKNQVLNLAGMPPLPDEQAAEQGLEHPAPQSTAQPLPQSEKAQNKEEKGMLTPAQESKAGDYYLVKTQLEEAKKREEKLEKDKERLWQEKEDAVKTWREQFQYNQNLLNERKLLTEGEQKVKDQLYQEKVIHEQERRGLVEQYEKEKITIQQQLEQGKRQTEAAYQGKLRARNLTIGVMGLFILLPLLIGASLILLHRGGVIQIPILTKLSAVSQEIVSEALDPIKKKAPKSEDKITSQPLAEQAGRSPSVNPTIP